MGSLTSASSVVLTFLVAAFCAKRATRDPMSVSFWICAFANNQYAIHHALGQETDLSESSFGVALRAPSCSDVVAVLDSNGGIYKRIWCGFELFFAQVAMPHRFGRTVNVALVNEHGVVSHGDGTSKDVNNMIQIIDSVRISQA